MIESTFTATHSSFYAIMSLVEHFGNLRSTIGGIILSIPLIRLLQSLVNKLLGRPPPTTITPASFLLSLDSHTLWANSSRHWPRNRQLNTKLQMEKQLSIQRALTFIKHSTISLLKILMLR